MSKPRSVSSFPSQTNNLLSSVADYSMDLGAGAQGVIQLQNLEKDLSSWLSPMWYYRGPHITFNTQTYNTRSPGVSIVLIRR